MRLTTPVKQENISRLRVGNLVYITGTIYTARDAAHKKVIDLIKKGKKPPFPLSGQIIYYTGPTPARPGKVIGACGPTTSYRMDPYTPLLLSKGIKITIGKGPRSERVIDALKRHKAVYLAALGGAGALISKCILKAEVIAFKELGPEAIYRLNVKDFPAIVVNDVRGKDLYKKVTADVTQELKAKEPKNDKVQKNKRVKRKRKN